MEINEEKRIKFMEYAGKRVNNVLHDIQILEPMARSNSYDFTKEDVEKMFTAMQNMLDSVKEEYNKKFEQKAKAEKKLFSFDDVIVPSQDSENITDENDANIINQIKAEINSTADTNIYQVEDEYDGRHTLQIKPNIQFDTVLAGVLIEGTPANNEIDSILKNKPTNTGVWISKKSRDSFKKILIDNNLTNFSIDESGYLFETEKKNNEMSKKLDNIIKSER